MNISETITDISEGYIVVLYNNAKQNMKNAYLKKLKFIVTKTRKFYFHSFKFHDTVTVVTCCTTKTKQ